MAGAQHPPAPSPRDPLARPATPATRLEPLPTGGVLEPPLGSALTILLSLALVIGAGFVLWQNRAAVAGPLDHFSLAPWLGSAETVEEPDYETDEDATPAAPVAVPEAPSWTLARVSDAIQVAGPRLRTLLEEGRAEMTEFGDLGSEDENRSARALRHWQSWGQIWQNRLEIITTDFPPSESCAVHAAMEPACQSLEEVRSLVARIPEADSLADAESRFELASVALEAFLNPPEPEESEEDPTEDEDGTAGSGDTGSGEAGSGEADSPQA